MSKLDQALKDYRVLIRRLAHDSTLSNAQLAALDLASKELGLSDDDKQGDVATLLRHQELLEKLSEVKQRVQTLEDEAAKLGAVIDRCLKEMDEAREQREQTVGQLELARTELDELDTLEADNPRLFDPDETEAAV